ncbi:MAG: hypothetical protein K9J16_03010 [Melioribacteraceae bacterium]|nr:hypothetical protein [Melioribacteraceae bacterium]MCF8355469.1 hypothetical protein [Melioribacteraceae bacterium]MCF8392554.1 hypothetical protein [Melioribacteraceae bacterium]MCF8418431.1 hypothetical protein [Melioribacteraceae bacterium]
MGFAQVLLNGEKLTKNNFADPPKAMGVLPFWFWNGEMEEEEMRWQMKEYHSKGISGLFIHGRFGESIGYLSDTWFERTKHAVKIAKEIGIDVWVYDEMNWPSGSAYRKVPKENPKLRQKYLEMVALPVPGPIFTFLEATDDRYVNTGDSKPIVAYACSEDEFNGNLNPDTLIDLTPNLSFNAVIPWEAPKGNWRLLYFLEKEIDYYIDALNPDSTKKFLDETHEKYKSAVGEEFGGVMPGFYTDEPAMHYYHVGMQNQVIPWTTQMFKIFRERRGYDLKPYLPALFLDMGEKTAQVRFDFWKTLTEQYSESYYKQIRDWCEANNVLFTGHLLGEEWIWMHSRCEGNIFKHLKHMHITGVDHLYPIVGSKDAPSQHVALKIASSAAHHYGSSQLLCESMGGTYWDCTLERMKWIANWEYALGVTIFNNHGYHYSIEGERKRDWPPSQFYHHTWWKYYDHFVKYMSRLGHMLSGGKHVAKILMLYPINSAWANYKPSGPTGLFNLMQSDFDYLTDLFLRLHYDFDYTDEDILADAEVVDGKLKINQEEFSVIFLPPITALQKSAFDKLNEFVSKGGTLIADTIIPNTLLDEEPPDYNEKIRELFGKDPAELLMNLTNGNSFNISKSNSIGEGSVYLIEGKGLSSEKKEAEIKNLLDQVVVPDITISEEDVFYLHKIKDDFDLYFLTNTQQKKLGQVEITFEKVGTPELWNPETGEIEKMNIYSVENNRLKLTLPFDSTQSHFIIIRDELERPYVTSTNLLISELTNGMLKGYAIDKIDKATAEVVTEAGKKTVSVESIEKLDDIKLDGNFSFNITEDNVLCIGKYKMMMEDEKSNVDDIVKEDYDDNNWLNVTMGAWEMQLPQERDDASYPVTLWYRTSFVIENVPDNPRILIDGFSGKEYQLYINGQEVKDKGSRSKIDAEIKQVDIKNFVKEGKNIIAVKLVAVRRTDGLLDLIKIVGDFTLNSNNNIYTIGEKVDKISLGDWAKQGYPFYSGTGVYKTEFNLPNDYLKGRLFLDVNCGEDVLEVKVNESDSKLALWNPYRLDITEMVKKGNNKIELSVTNTLINMLEAVEKESGIFQPPVIIHAPEYEIEF